jgi:hypothetical protein
LAPEMLGAEHILFATDYPFAHAARGALNFLATAQLSERPQHDRFRKLGSPVFKNRPLIFRPHLCPVSVRALQRHLREDDPRARVLRHLSHRGM